MKEYKIVPLQGKVYVVSAKSISISNQGRLIYFMNDSEIVGCVNADAVMFVSENEKTKTV